MKGFLKAVDFQAVEHQRVTHEGKHQVSVGNSFWHLPWRVQGEVHSGGRCAGRHAGYTDLGGRVLVFNNYMCLVSHVSDKYFSGSYQRLHLRICGRYL